MDAAMLEPRAVCQVAVVVRDIESASAAWARVLGVPVPAWSLTAGWEDTHAMYRGEPSSARAKLAFFDLGQIRLELIEPDAGPSIWREFLDAHGQGIHHVAFNVPSMGDAVARLSAVHVPLVQQGDFPGGCYAYCDGTETLGAILELLARR